LLGIIIIIIIIIIRRRWLPLAPIYNDLRSSRYIGREVNSAQISITENKNRTISNKTPDRVVVIIIIVITRVTEYV